MSLDLYQRETAERMDSLAPMLQPETGAFDGFARGTGEYTMQGFAKAGRAASLAASTLPIAVDAFTGGTELQDSYFKFHDETFGNAVDYWMPRPNEVGAAGQIAGTLLSTLPLVIASPAAAVGAIQLSTAEDLAREGVSPGKAQAVGAIQGAGLGFGVYMPIFGQSLWQRMLVGGAGFNVVQGAAMRGASDVILSGTPGEGQYEAFDSTALTLDTLLGLAFGGISHLSPVQRAEGARMWQKMTDWGKSLKPSDIEALATLRQAQHANVDSLPGRPVDITDMDAHTRRLRTATEQLLRDEPVNVSDVPARFEPVPERWPEAQARVKQLQAEAERMRIAENLPEPPTGIEIPRADNLTNTERAVESRLAKYLSTKTDEAIARYQKEFGNVLNTDNARELSPDYAATKDSRSMLSAAVHEPASWLVKEIYRQELAKPAPAGKDNVVAFTAGGTGAGKTSAIMRAGVNLQRHQIIYDTNMNNFQSAASKIDQALAAGKEVKLYYVHRDPVESLVRGALPRAMRTGRTVPLAAHLDTHAGAADTIRRIAEKYKENPDVGLFIIDNTRGKNETGMGSLETIKPIDYNQLEGQLKAALEKEYRDGRISKTVYEETLKRRVPQAGRGDGPGAGGQPEPRAAGSGSTGREAPQESQLTILQRVQKRLQEFLQPKNPEANLTEPSSPSTTAASRADPLASEAQRFVDENPNAVMVTGHDADGQPITRPIREVLADARAQVEQARADAKLFEVAAGCLMGVN